MKLVGAWDGAVLVNEINRNMRCIEISIAYVFEAFASEINRNMRCIEITTPPELKHTLLD